MNIKETKQLLTILKLSYPNSYKATTKEDATATVQNYQGFFGEYQTPIVVQALRNYIKKNVYPPTIAGLQEQIDLLLNSEDTHIELWNAFSKAVSNCLWNTLEQFNSLPNVCQAWIGSPQAMRDMALTEPDKFNTVTRGQFLKTIGEIKERNETRESLPQNIKDMIEIRGVTKQLVE
ncbi:MAG: hypothetical protein LLG05_18840 [Porphyromonadaceae bacterium]|nr:hypothetical protein [Porphyromonadaceae bacterium]